MKKINKKSAIIIAIVVLIVCSIIAFLSIRSFLGKSEYEVSFYSDTGTLLAVEKINRNGTPTPPNNPQIQYGKIFQKWDTDFTNVKKDLDVYPESINFAGKANVFALPGTYGKHGDTVILPLSLCGDVCLSGFDISVSYDSNVLELESVFNEDGAVIYNTESKGVVRINYTSVENTLADVDICSLKFQIIGEVEKTDVAISIESVCANNDDETFFVPETNLINASVYVLPNKGGVLGD
ncbi:MAG: hypothetical protein IJE19_00315 [Clostridia bacterium]|nr:hypothetical protein [Clostridia bacterium]